MTMHAFMQYTCWTDFQSQHLGACRCRPVASLQDRVRYEADALREQHSLCPEHVPAIYHFDAKNALIVMQYLPPPHVILRKAIVQVGVAQVFCL